MEPTGRNPQQLSKARQAERLAREVANRAHRITGELLQAARAITEEALDLEDDSETCRRIIDRLARRDRTLRAQANRNPAIQPPATAQPEPMPARQNTNGARQPNTRGRQGGKNTRA